MKQAVISGGSHGIGAAITQVLSDEGLRVTVLDITIPHHKIIGVQYIKVDLTNEREVKKAWKKTVRPADLLFVNAGIMRRGDLFHTHEDAFDQLISVNIKAYWLTIKHAELQEDATVVFTGSRHAIIPPSNPAIYGLTKNAADYLAKVLQASKPLLDVRIIHPGSIHTSIATMELPTEEHEAKIRTTIEPEELASKVLAFLRTKHKTFYYDAEEHVYKSC